MFGGASLVAVGYAMRLVGRTFLADRWDWAASTSPGGFGRVSPFGGGMPAYVVSTVGSSVLFLVGVLWVAERFGASLPARVLARAGKVTFTIYVAHGVIPWFLTSQGWVGQNFGLQRSLGIAFGSWFVAILAGAAMHKAFGTGPLEWLLRQLSGSALRVQPVASQPVVNQPVANQPRQAEGTPGVSL
jgi:uncharacterized membrane protein YeiB